MPSANVRFESSTSLDGTAAAVNQTAAATYPTSLIPHDWPKATGNARRTIKKVSEMM